MKQDVEIVRPKEWLEEALITLEKIKAGAKSSEEAITFNKFVFTHYQGVLWHRAGSRERDGNDGHLPCLVVANGGK